MTATPDTTTSLTRNWTNTFSTHKPMAIRKTLARRYRRLPAPRGTLTQPMPPWPLTHLPPPLPIRPNTNPRRFLQSFTRSPHIHTHIIPSPQCVADTTRASRSIRQKPLSPRHLVATNYPELQRLPNGAQLTWTLWCDTLPNWTSMSGCVVVIARVRRWVGSSHLTTLLNNAGFLFNITDGCRRTGGNTNQRRP